MPREPAPIMRIRGGLGENAGRGAAVRRPWEFGGGVSIVIVSGVMRLSECFVEVWACE